MEVGGKLRGVKGLCAGRWVLSGVISAPNQEPMSTASAAPLVAAIDQGTSSSRVILFDSSARPQAVHQEEAVQINLHPGWCQMDPTAIMASVNACIEAVATKVPINTPVAAVGVTNQRETTVAWDKITGAALCDAVGEFVFYSFEAPVPKIYTEAPPHHALNIQFGSTPAPAKLSRSSWTVRRLKANTTLWLNVCGLPISTYFSGVKLRWLIDNDENVKKAHDDGRLMFGTVDSWLIYNLTGGADGGVHVTDVTNASRTMLMNIKTLQWDAEMIEFFQFEKVHLPSIKSSAETYGYVKSGPFAGIPISGCVGDQQAALLGQRCTNPGDLKNTYGTGCFMLFNTGEDVVIPETEFGLLTTVAYQLGPHTPPIYALEGSIAVAGAAVRWLRDNLGIIRESAEVGSLAESVDDTGGVYFVPAFSGLYAPYWRDDARGCLVGLTQYTNKAHICRATLESVCWQTKEIVDMINKSSSTPLKSLKVDGGLTAADLCMQLQADILGIPVSRPDMAETTAFGAAIAAGLAVGCWSEREVIGDQAQMGTIRVFESKIGETERAGRFAAWKKAVVKSFAS
ncbi:hypothetical protein HDU83_003735 [Entophlyctis luteolus]|nr:hypothetical protein HDU83_003735 [Entophlyctis luteolus]